MVSQQSFEDLTDEVIQQQGFLVIGFPSGVDGYKIGHTTDRVMQFVMPTNYEVVATARQADWTLQNDLIEKLRPNWRRFPEVRGGTFVKLKPLGSTLIKQPEGKTVAG